MKTLFLDIDNVIYPTLDYILKQYNALTESDIKIEDVKKYNLTEFLEHKDILDIVMNNPDLFESMTTTKDIIDSVSILNDSYKLYLLSSTSPKIIPARIKTLSRDFPFLYEEQIIFANNKALFKGDVIVEDNLHNIKVFKNTNKKALSVCIDMPYNRGNYHYVDYRSKNLSESLHMLISFR